jgi:hypothetical protein
MFKLNLDYVSDEARRALAQYGAAEIAASLADVPDEDAGGRQEAEKFVRMYGPLTPLDIDTSIGMLTPWTDDKAADQVLRVAGFFRSIWKAKKTREQIDGINANLNLIFNWIRDRKPGGEALMRADFDTGEFLPVPRTLLEVLIIELMHSRNRLIYCGRPECGRHLIQQSSRHKYCSAFCSEDMRARKLQAWHKQQRKKARK